MGDILICNRLGEWRWKSNQNQVMKNIKGNQRINLFQFMMMMMMLIIAYEYTVAYALYKRPIKFKSIW